MNKRVLILLAALCATPSLVSAQALDSARVHGLALEVAEDIARLDHRSDLWFVDFQLSYVEAYTGIDIEIPQDRDPPQGQGRGHLELVYSEHGSQALLDEAVLLAEAQGTVGWRGVALEMMGRREGPRAALDAAQERGWLASHFHHLLNGAGVQRLELVLAWLAEADLDAALRLDLRAEALGFGSVYAPYAFWQRADSLPEPYRTQVRLQALMAGARQDTVPSDVVNAELTTLLEVAEDMESDEARRARRTLAVACARRQMPQCDDLDLPAESSAPGAWTDVVNLTGQGAFEQATRRLEDLRRTEPPLVVARAMAQALEHLDRNCLMDTCDLVRTDSLADAWLDEILAAEADAMAGRIERTATWNGSDDLTELRRALGVYWGGRDMEAVRRLLERMEDAEAVGHVLFSFIQSAPAVDLIGAVELYLAFAPADLEPLAVYYGDLIRAGRRDLAEEMIRRASPNTASRARMAWVGRLVQAGRGEEARSALRTLMSEATYEYPTGDAQLVIALQRLRMVDEYLAHVRALPTPLQRVNALLPLLAGWVQMQQTRVHQG